jgi:starch synthase
MVSSEVAPFAHTGGLGDAVSGLAFALAELGCDVVIVTPRYGVTRAPEDAAWWAEPVRVPIALGEPWRTLGVLEATVGGATASLRVCFLDEAILFDRDGIYGDSHGTFGDNEIRFAAMSAGALAVAARLWREESGRSAGADVVHAHDWHAAMAVILAARGRVKRVLTVHNLAFQGVYGPDMLPRIGLSAEDQSALTHHGQVNLLRGAIAFADRVTTVSPSYASEIRGPREGRGLDGVLRDLGDRLVGITNGIDTVRFDPATDRALPQRYDVSSAMAGKGACKAALVAELGLGNGPLFASVGRLADQKGIDLLLAILPGLVERGACFALVGSGDASLERGLRAAEERFPGRVASRIVFDGDLARRVYGGSDFFVVPSRYEPCGLTQLYAMRYGSIPVVTPVGGLKDTVSPISSLAAAGTGFVADAPDAVGLLVGCEDALTLAADAASRWAAVDRAMRRDSGWSAPARAYLSLYES